MAAQEYCRAVAMRTRLPRATHTAGVKRLRCGYESVTRTSSLLTRAARLCLSQTNPPASRGFPPPRRPASGDCGTRGTWFAPPRSDAQGAIAEQTKKFGGGITIVSVDSEPAVRFRLVRSIAFYSRRKPWQMIAPRRAGRCEEHEMRYCTEKFGVSKERLRDAVKKVRNSVSAVQKELQG